jgi:tetratricopeptide (TPR) repeat protein
MTKTQNPDQLNDFIEKAREIYETKRNLVLGVTVALVVLIGGGLYAKLSWLPKREADAQKHLYISQFFFEQDSFARALNGGNIPNEAGFKKVASDYSFTKSANLAKLYAGICELNLKQYDAAIKHLEDYSPKADILEAQKYGLLGDAYMEKGQTDKGLKCYAEAADASENPEIAPLQLLKAGMAHEKAGKKADALKFYQRIKDEFPRSEEFQQIDKYIARVSE